MIKCNVTVCGTVSKAATCRTNKEGKAFVYRLKVGLHIPSGNLYDVADAVLCSYLELVKVRSDYFNLVILYLGSLLGLYQLEAV